MFVVLLFTSFPAFVLYAYIFRDHYQSDIHRKRILGNTFEGGESMEISFIIFSPSLRLVYLFGLLIRYNSICKIPTRKL